LVLIAQTLPKASASTAILKTLGFAFSGEHDHPEDGRVLVWRASRRVNVQVPIHPPCHARYATTFEEGTPMWKSLTVVPLAFFLVIPTVALAQDAAPSEKSLPEQIVDAFNGVFGVHPGKRANHAKGVVLEGQFTPSAAAASVSKAAHFRKSKKLVPVTIRFSNATGLPAIPDADPGASPHGMAVKFRLPDGSSTDIVVISFNGFPVATGADFRDFLLAIGGTKPDDPKPTALDTFLETHPAAKAFVETPKPPPVSFGTLSYFGVNAFKFTNSKGVSTFGRYQLRPVAGEQVLSQEQIATRGPDYLVEEIRARIRQGPVKFTLLLQVAEPGDKIDDPSITWPDTRKKIELGTISITKAVADSQAAEKKLLFVPGSLVPGVEAADPMIAVRSSSYIVSLGRRSQP
jgi:catalase